MTDETATATPEADELTGVTRIEGASVETSKGRRKDAGWRRIMRLTDQRMDRRGTADGGWSILYRDRVDGRFWELTYPQGHLHGGGPPLLQVLSDDEARSKYGEVGG